MSRISTNTYSVTMLIASDATPQPIAFPCELSAGEQWLIGADSICDLQFDAPELPAIHSVVRVEDGRLFLESLVQHPTWQIRGQAVQSTLLNVGETAQLGEFALTLASIEPIEAVPSNEFTEFDAESLTDWNAEELVDAIEHDLSQMRRRESLQSAGVQTLIEAVRQQMDGQSAAPSEPAESIEIDAVLLKLALFAEKLEQQTFRLTQRESDLIRIATELMETQHLVVDRLEQLTDRLRHFHPAPQSRAA